MDQELKDYYKQVIFKEWVSEYNTNHVFREVINQFVMKDVCVVSIIHNLITENRKLTNNRKQPGR